MRLQERPADRAVAHASLPMGRADLHSRRGAERTGSAVSHRPQPRCAARRHERQARRHADDQDGTGRRAGCCPPIRTSCSGAGPGQSSLIPRDLRSPASAVPLDVQIPPRENDAGGADGVEQGRHGRGGVDSGARMQCDASTTPARRWPRHPLHEREALRPPRGRARTPKDAAPPRGEDPEPGVEWSGSSAR